MDPLTSDVDDTTTTTTAAEWEFLSEIYALLADGGALNTKQSEPIVRFQHPDELKVVGRQTLHCAPQTQTTTKLGRVSSACVNGSLIRRTRTRTRRVH